MFSPPSVSSRTSASGTPPAVASATVKPRSPVTASGVAVAGFGQKLRGDPWMTADYGWDRIIDQAQGARGEDPYGDRAEFVQLVRAAQGLPPMRTP